jgi:hypothetical protein
MNAPLAHAYLLTQKNQTHGKNLYTHKSH